MASHRAAAKAATVNLSRYRDVKPQAVSFKWWQRWSEARWEEVPTAHSQVLKKYDCGSLTPPTSSKWPSPLAMSCPLKAQEKETSRTGSLVTWQGNTMLSPTIISISAGPWVILVGSATDRKKKKKWKGVISYSDGCQSHTTFVATRWAMLCWFSRIKAPYDGILLPHQKIIASISRFQVKSLLGQQDDFSR